MQNFAKITGYAVSFCNSFVFDFAGKPVFSHCSFTGTVLRVTNEALTEIFTIN